MAAVRGAGRRGRVHDVDRPARPDVAQYHDRGIVVLPVARWAARMRRIVGAGGGGSLTASRT
ncbi:MAG TPA: hypothetical protein VEZ48_12030 [Sphingomonadaceae bacterium]|nr:hypothetical protein [Sphingomonadaceae bacterium]